MTPLEARYRRLLTLLPPSYREVRGEEMVDTFLLSMQQDEAEDDLVVQLSGHPSWPERLSILGLAVRLRWGGDLAPPRYQVHGGAVRWCVTAIVLIQAVSTVPLNLAFLWISRDPPIASPAGSWLPFLVVSSSWVSAAVGVLWIPAFFALLQGQRRAAQLLALLAMVPLLVDAVGRTSQFPNGSSGLLLLAGWTILAVDICVVLGMFAFHRDAPPVRSRRWLASGGLALAALGASVLVPGVSAWVLVDGLSLWCLAGILSAVAVLALARQLPSAQRAQTCLGISLLCTAAGGLRAISVAELATHDGWASLPESAQVALVAQLVLVAAAGLPPASWARIRFVNCLPPAMRTPEGSPAEQAQPGSVPRAFASRCTTMASAIRASRTFWSFDMRLR